MPTQKIKLTRKQAPTDKPPKMKTEETESEETEMAQKKPKSVAEAVTATAYVTDVDDRADQMLHHLRVYNRSSGLEALGMFERGLPSEPEKLVP